MSRRAQEVWTRLLEEWLIPQSEVRTTRSCTRIVTVTVLGVGRVGTGSAQEAEGSLHVEFYYWVFTIPPTQVCLPGPLSGTCIQGSPVFSLSRHWAAVLTHLFHTSRKAGKHASSMRNPHPMAQLTSWHPAERLLSSHIKTGNTWKNHLEPSLRIVLLPSAVFHTFKLK